MKPYKILVVHNFYQNPGGEDTVLKSEKALLQTYGHEVIEYTDSNDRVETMSPIQAGIHTFWSEPSYHAIKRLIITRKPDLVHFHNTFLLISPSAYYACSRTDVPVVQSLHNYRMYCPSALFFRDGMVCEDCFKKPFAWPGIYHRCYRNSTAQSALVATFLSSHRLLRTWQNRVNVFIVLSEFSRQKFLKGGLPADKIVVKPNFVQKPKKEIERAKDYALYVGRLSQEKGIESLLSVWKQIGWIPLKIVGDGPMRILVENFVGQYPHAEYLGYKPHEQVRALTRSCRFVIVPSICYENFPVVLIEAFSQGVPVVASRLGSMAEIVHDGETGILFEPGNTEDMKNKISWLWNSPGDVERMGRNARQEYEEKYTPERNYQMLMEIYSKVIEEKK